MTEQNAASSDPQKTFYITTPIYYVNDAPHIGHAYTTIMADVLARYHKLLGYDDVFLLTGTDEHGQKVQQAAEKRGVTPQAHADEYVQRFQNLWPELHINHDRFIRTTEPQHVTNVQAALQYVFDKGDIYKSEYKGYYHIADETFLTPDKVKQEEIDSGEVVELAEENYFFKLSKYRDQLLKHIDDNPDFILPEARKNWVVAQLKAGGEDLCISRPKSRLEWGIELPFDSNYVCYVWFDALLNYLTGIDYDCSKKWGEQDETVCLRWENCTHLIGKDILQHHAIYWPMMLMGLDIPLPKHILAHGWWMGDEGDKISKRKGGTGAWLWLKDEYGADAMRYFLVREMILGNDSNISEALFIERYNSDLANNLGNLIFRAGKMVERHYATTMPKGDGPMGDQYQTACKALREKMSEKTEDDGPGTGKELIIISTQEVINRVKNDIPIFSTHKILESITAFLGSWNIFFDSLEPWKLKPVSENDELATILWDVLDGAVKAAALLYPVMPKKAQQIGQILNANLPLDILLNFPHVETLRSGAKLDLSSPVFARVDKKKIQAKKEQPQENKKEENLISIDEFFKSQLKTAKVLEAEAVEGSSKLIKMEMELAGGEKRQIIGGLAKHYTPEELVGKTVIVVANLKPAKLMGLDSEGMVLAASKGKKMRLLTVEDIEGQDPLPPGCKVG